MRDPGIVVLGIPIPSSSGVFLTLVAVHVAAGLVCAVVGAVAMLSPKREGRHPTTHLFGLGILSFGAGAIGRTARRGQRPGWLRIHIAGMGLSYILLLTAFYVDNGPSLPLWRSLPALAYWLGPGIVGLPILARALLRHPLVRRNSA